MVDEKTLREDLDHLRTKADFLQEIWDKREVIASDLVLQARLIAEDGKEGEWSAYSTAAKMMVGEIEHRLTPEQRAKMVKDITQTLKVSCGYIEVIEDYVMVILKTYLLRAETIMKGNGWKLPDWERPQWLDEIHG